MSAAAEYVERTGPRIRAYLASMRPLRGCAGLADKDDFQRGRSLIEQLAIWHDSSDAGQAGAFSLTPTDCANVLSFMRSCEPLDGEDWWHDTNRPGPSQLCGFFAVLEAMEEDLRMVP